jgi:(S)-2-hydroxyglutarate dehydrogenase
MAKPEIDIIVVGGGIVGLATAMQLAMRHPEKSIQVLEKEPAIARHQTGRNSGVIHAGVYYAPGSMKADFCKRGVDATIRFCNEHKITFEQCGKLLVATDAAELQRMEALYDRCLENGLEPERLDQAQLRALEPNIAGVGALLVKTTGIVDYVAMSQAMARVITELGGKVRTNIELTGIVERDDGVEVTTPDETLTAKHLVVCAGLQADRVARLARLDIDFRIIPFRGEYYRLNARNNNIVKHLIYPIPDPALPFLGVHLTRMIDGSVTVGPNAVLGFAREGYGKFQIDPGDVADMLRFPGFWATMRRNWRHGLTEFRNSISKAGYLKLCRKYCPSLTLDDLEPYPAGIRAQAVLRDGTLVQDFLIKETKRTIHVCNAPSPAATAAMPIAEFIADRFALK